MAQTSHRHIIGRPCTLRRHEREFRLASPHSYSTVALTLLAGRPDIYGFLGY